MKKSYSKSSRRYPQRYMHITLGRPFLNVYCGLDFRQLISNFNPSCPDPVQREEIKFYFRTSLWCHKRFYEGLKGLHNTFRCTTNKCENKN